MTRHSSNQDSSNQDSSNQDSSNQGDWAIYGVTEDDLLFLEQRGKSRAQVWAELRAMGGERATPIILDSARFDNGYMYPLHLSEVRELLDSWPTIIEERRMAFFVPAAGAASRQFEMLKTILHHPFFSQQETPQQMVESAVRHLNELSQKSELSGTEKATQKSLQGVVKKLMRFWEEGIVQRKFAFVDALQDLLEKQGVSWEDVLTSQDIKTVCHSILDKEAGLACSFLPKALLFFHAYPTSHGTTEARLAIEEHIRALAPLFSGSASIKLHFAISEEHEAYVKQALVEIFDKPNVKEWLQQFGFTPKDVEVTWSFQGAHTDAVALDLKSGQLARMADNTPLTRKAGHGALIENLANLDADGIWVQNIDNILYDNPPIKRAVLHTKKIMAALTFKLQEQIHNYIRRLHQCRTAGEIEPSLQKELLEFIEQRLTLKVVDDVFSSDDTLRIIETFLHILDRPVMVSGYVPLKPGQKGGGPFVLEMELDGIRVRKTNTVEGAEFEGGQNHPIFQSGICFNPVNFFLSTQRFDGTHFDLSQYTDPSRFFVSEKTDPNGNPIKAYERPGLWNGALAQVLQVSIGNLACTFAAVKDTSGPESFLSQLHQPGTPPVITPLDRERGIVDEELTTFFLSRS